MAVTASYDLTFAHIAISLAWMGLLEASYLTTRCLLFEIKVRERCTCQNAIIGNAASSDNRTDIREIWIGISSL